jgi:hypothetical protein
MADKKDINRSNIVLSKPSELSKFSLSFEYDKTYSEVKHQIHTRKDKSL